MWLESRNRPKSLESKIAATVCQDPAQVYLDEHPQIAETIETEEDKEKWVETVEI